MTHPVHSIIRGNCRYKEYADGSYVVRMPDTTIYSKYQPELAFKKLREIEQFLKEVMERVKELRR